MKNFFAVLGGMGSIATESYIRLVNENTHASNDQEYLDYVIFNHSSVPDRTAYIFDRSKPDPLTPLNDDIAQITAMGASFIVLICNTAHYFYDQFQAQTPIPILHMPRNAVDTLEKHYPASSAPRVGFLGTEGSLRSEVYQHEIEAKGYTFVRPTDSTQKDVDYLIYHEIKERARLNKDLYMKTLETMFTQMHCDTVILGCTELSVLAEAFPDTPGPVVDAQREIALKTIELAKQNRANAQLSEK
ncbi:MAG: amino acid racemase [Bifidobacteriaceae bacterium]|jgi:aspartate racemase|nr:amino acid racemase [Bifidobacteriaceae bacterium]MCI1914201.1 amino acid racemase [Bifidobacteriaceae bacterium]